MGFIQVVSSQEIIILEDSAAFRAEPYRQSLIVDSLSGTRETEIIVIDGIWLSDLLYNHQTLPLDTPNFRHGKPSPILILTI